MPLRSEVGDFVDLPTVRDQERLLTQATTRLSEGAFRAVWDNSDDAEYDRYSFGDVVLVPSLQGDDVQALRAALRQILG